MNGFLKITLIGFIIIALYAVNNIIFDVLFNLDKEYLKNIAWSVLFSGFFTALEITLFRMFTGKLNVKLGINRTFGFRKNH
jgi:hypothetical protein|tara:strand:- start:1521 stop:1763 length:243 start_codon:yes stop_codon:yes gene_type:complete